MNYYDPKFPGSYSGPDKFYKGILSQGRTDISLGTVKAWLKSQDIYTNHRLYLLKSVVKGPRVIVPTKAFLFDSDTANLVSYDTDNKGYKHILIVIDILSRYAWTKPLKSLKSQETTQALLEILPPQAEKLRKDGGSEYKGGLDTELRMRGIDHFHTTNTQKASFAERLIRTLKSWLLKYMEQTNSHRWLDVLQTFTTSYNHSYHRSIGTTPNFAWHSMSNPELWSRQYLPRKTVVKPKSKRLPRGTRGYKFKIGDHVKLRHWSAKFDRAYHRGWNSEIFTIVQRELHQNIPVKDFNNSIIGGWFYNHELQRVIVPEDRTYKIDKILKTKCRGKKTFYLVSLENWPPAFNSWIYKTRLETNY